jgi:predicted neuraminidase
MNMKRLFFGHRVLLGVTALMSLAAGVGAADFQSGLVKSEFICDHPPFPTSHASTIVETREGFLAAWFGGSRERSPDVSIWTARNDGNGWSAPREVANGIRDQGWTRYPCWNPVLFLPKGDSLLLFYKVGPSPSSWWGMLLTSDDAGKDWSKPMRLPSGILGPVRNKPIQLPDRTILCGSSTEEAGWVVHMERTLDPRGGWSHSAPLNSAMEFGAIQPTLLAWPGGRIEALCRTKQQVITQSWSTNNGVDWSRMMPTMLPNPNSAIDSVMLADGRALLVYNHSPDDRGVLNVAVSKDGQTWQAALVLENQPGAEFSYPAVIRANDGMVHVTYTWNRQRIKHVVIDPYKLQPRDMPGGNWPG